MIDTASPLWGMLFYIALLVMVAVLLDRVFPVKPEDTDAEARRAFPERKARELSGRDA